MAEDEVARGAETENQVDFSRPVRFSEKPYDAHHGGDAHAAGNQDHAVRFLSCKDERSVGRFHLDQFATFQFVVQEARDKSLVLTLHGDLDSVAPRWTRRDSVGTPD